MILGKVHSRVVSTAKLSTFPDRPLLEVEPLPEFGSQSVVAIDRVSAGPGDLVLVMAEGTGARQSLDLNPEEPLPAQHVIVGVVDSVER